MAFESAHYQLTRCIASSTSSSYIPELIVRRFLRQFYSHKPTRCLSNKMTIGVFTLWQPRLVDKEHLKRLNKHLPGPVYDCSSFAAEGVRYILHNKNCNYPISGCCHFAFGFDQQGNQRIFQLLTSFFSERFAVPIFYVNSFSLELSLAASIAKNTKDRDSAEILGEADCFVGSSY